jgi:uncharacterized protein (TIGR02145 family)
MLSPRLTNCPECANIPSLLKKIDCKLAELGNNLYNNISYMLNKPIEAGNIIQLIAYRRILSYKYCNPNYVHEYSVQMIASKVIRLTAGCVSKCNELERCLEEPCDITIVPNPTTTSTSTLPITTTTSTTIAATSICFGMGGETPSGTYSCNVEPEIGLINGKPYYKFVNFDCIEQIIDSNGPVYIWFSISDDFPNNWVVSALNDATIGNVYSYISSVALNYPIGTWEIINSQAFVYDSSIGDCPTTTTSTTIVPTTTTTSSSSTTTSTTTICQDCIEHDVTIGTQVWTGCNLDVTTYRNGDPIPEVTDQGAWNSLTTGAWCYYNNDPANKNTYGKLYNWHAVNDPRGLAPIGYHIPSDEEWTTLVNYLGGDNVAGGHLKEPGFCHWEDPNTDADNISGFTGLPSGNRGLSLLDPFVGITLFTYFWTSTPYLSGADGYAYQLRYVDGLVVRGFFTVRNGFAVRLIKDTETTTTTTSTSSSTTTSTTTLPPTTTTTTTCAESHPYQNNLISKITTSPTNFTGSLVEACAAADCLNAATCLVGGLVITYWDSLTPPIGALAYGGMTGCGAPDTTGYYVIDISGTYTVVEMLTGAIQSYPTC